MYEYIILENFKIDKYIYNENNGLWYELQGDYYIPCPTFPVEEENKPIDILCCFGYNKSHDIKHVI